MVDETGQRSSAGDVLLLQFAREPVPGRVKTRLLPTLSPEQACELHCELVMWTARQLLDARLGQVQVCVAGDPAASLFAQCTAAGVASVSRQQGADLGERMFNALECGLQNHSRVILVGSDCPAITPAYLGLAVDALAHADVVIGPAEDGGFVLIGVTAVQPAMFSSVQWGTSEVYRVTRENLQRLQLRCAELPTLADIDRPEDLMLWERARQLSVL